MASIVEITSIDELASVRLAWTALQGRMREAAEIHTLDAQLAAASTLRFDLGEALRVVQIRSADEWVGFLPLAVRRKQTIWGRLRVLEYLVRDSEQSSGPIGPNLTATLWAGLNYVAAHARHWDVLELGPITIGSPCWSRTERAMIGAGLQSIRLKQSTRTPANMPSQTDRTKSAGSTQSSATLCHYRWTKPTAQLLRIDRWLRGAG